MGDPLTIGLLVASTAVSAYGTIQAGNAKAEAAEFERAQYEDQRKINQIQALDEENDRRKRLNQVLASNRASAAGMGISTDASRSFLSIQQDSANEAERDIGRIRLNAAGENRRLSLAADQARLEGSAARRSGYIGAAGTLLKGGYEYTQLKKV